MLVGTTVVSLQRKMLSFYHTKTSKMSYLNKWICKFIFPLPDLSNNGGIKKSHQLSGAPIRGIQTTNRFAISFGFSFLHCMQHIFWQNNSCTRASAWRLYFVNCYSAAPRQFLGHCQGESLTQSMKCLTYPITVLYYLI